MKNFILTKDNYKMFVFLFNKMLQLKGCIKEWSEYTGAKQRATLMKNAGFEPLYQDVTKTINSYILPNKITHKWQPVRGMGITMNITGGTFFHIPFGTKISACSQYIKFKDCLWSYNKSGGMTTYMVPFAPNSSIREKVQYDEMYERDYWRDTLNDYEDFPNMDEIDHERQKFYENA